jgi:hypothetical protein
LEALHSQLAQLTPPEFFEGKIVLLAQLLGLLIAFIGPGLTSRLMYESWPTVRLPNDFGSQGGTS